MIHRLIILLLIVGCDMFESDDDVDTGHWTCRPTLCTTNTTYGYGDSNEMCQTSNTPILIHANSKAVAKSKCLDVFPEYQLPSNDTIVDTTCDCSKGVQDNLNSSETSYDDPIPADTTQQFWEDRN